MSTAPTNEQVKSAEQGASSRSKRHRGLLLVGLFKFSKAIFFGLIGFGALQLLHRNFGDLVMRLTATVPLDPEGHFVSLLMDRADLVGMHQLQMVGFSSLCYAAVCIVEGTGLVLEKVWAEYFTLTLTALALPWEIFKLVKQPNWFSVALMLGNVLVLAYLIWLVRRTRRREGAR